MLTMHAQVGSPLIALEEDSPWLNHCITGVEADFSQMACNAIASLSPLLASACERDTPMSPPPPALPGDTSDIEDTDEDTVQAPVRLLSFKIAPCISLDTITVEFPSFDVYLACLAENIAAFIEELFRMAADAVRGMVDSLTAMFSNAVQWAIDKIEELWNGVRSVIDGIGRTLGRRLEDVSRSDPEHYLKALSAAIGNDEALLPSDRLQLLDMVSKVADAHATGQSLAIHRRRQMEEEMDGQHAEHSRRRMEEEERIVADEGTSGATCAERSRSAGNGPISVPRAMLSLSLPMKAEIEVDIAELYDLNKDLLEEVCGRCIHFERSTSAASCIYFERSTSAASHLTCCPSPSTYCPLSMLPAQYGVKPKSLPISTLRVIPIYPPFLSLKLGFTLDVSIPMRVLVKLTGDSRVRVKAKLVLLCTGGRVDVDLSSNPTGTGRVSIVEMPSFGDSYVSVDHSLNGTIAASLGIQIDGHLEVGVGTMGSIFATAHAQFQWGAQFGVDMQLRKPNPQIDVCQGRDCPGNNTIRSFPLQLADNLYALRTYPRAVMEKIRTDDECSPTTERAVIAVASWAYIAKPRVRLDLVLQILSSSLIGNAGLPLSQPQLTTVQRRKIIKGETLLRLNSSRSLDDLRRYRQREINAARGKLLQSPWNLLQADWKAMHIWDFGGANINTDQLDFFFHGVSAKSVIRLVILSYPPHPSNCCHNPCLTLPYCRDHSQLAHICECTGHRRPMFSG